MSFPDRRLIALFLVSILWGCSPTPTPESLPQHLPYPDEERTEPVATLATLKLTIARLNPRIGVYPVQLPLPNQRAAAYRIWKNAFLDAMIYYKRYGTSERALWTAAELSRQGHNLDVERTGYLAAEIIERCLELYPKSVLCHHSSADYYASIRLTDDSLTNLERSLKFLRSHYGKRPNESVEEKYISLYAYRGEPTKAIDQIDRFLKLFPTTKLRSKLLAFRAELMAQP